MMGGVTWPPQEADASTAEANWAEKPFFFIMGIVNDPVVAVLAMGDPEIIPKNPEETTDTFAGPPE